MTRDETQAVGRGVRRLRRAPRVLMLYLFGGVLALICLIPLLWMVKTSFETAQFIRSSEVQFLPIRPTLDNYRDVLSNPNAMLGRSTINSLLVTLAATALTLAVTLAAAYSLSRFEFRWKLIVAMYFLLFYMIPRTLLLIGQFVMLANLGLVNNLMGLVILYAAGGIPLATWWLKGYFDSVPVELEEQAMIDGCTRLGALRRVVMPLAAPGVAAVGMILFIETWNEYMMALTLIQSAELQLLPVQIVNFMGAGQIEWGPTMAFSVIVAVPAVILFALAQRQIVGGLMSGFTR